MSDACVWFSCWMLEYEESLRKVRAGAKLRRLFVTSWMLTVDEIDLCSGRADESCAGIGQRGRGVVVVDEEVVRLCSCRSF